MLSGIAMFKRLLHLLKAELSIHTAPSGIMICFSWLQPANKRVLKTAAFSGNLIFVKQEHSENTPDPISFISAGSLIFVRTVQDLNA